MKNEQKEKGKCNEDSKYTKTSREFFMSNVLIMSKHYITAERYL